MPRVDAHHHFWSLQHVYPAGYRRRSIFLDHVGNLRQRLLEQNLIEERELTELLKDLKSHLDDPQTLVVSHVFFQTWGRKPEQ